MHQVSRILGVFITGVLAGVLSGVLVVSPSQAEVPLKQISSVLFNCPFQDTSDLFHFDSSLQSVRYLLEQKIDGKNQCLSKLQGLTSELETLQNYYGNVGNDTSATIEQEAYERALDDLNVEYSHLQSQGQGQSLRAQSISSIMSQLQWTVISGGASAEAIKFRRTQSQEDRFRLSLYGQVNKVLQTLMDLNSRGECQDAYFHWRSLVPQFMGVASLATGVTGSQNQALFGSVLAMAANFTNLLLNSREKKALNAITRVQNDQILACSYFSLQNAGCDYQRHADLSKDRAAIERILFLKVQEGENADFESYFLVAEMGDELDQVFQMIGTIGSPLTIDLQLLNQYMEAIRSAPDRIPPPPLSGTQSEKQRWLTDVRSLGIFFTEVDIINSTPIPIDKQIQQAIIDIENKKTKIQTVEEVLREKQSFEDLRHRIERDFPALLERIVRAKEFMQLFTNGGQSPVRKISIFPYEEGALLAIIDLLEKIETYLKITPDSASKDCVSSAKNRFTCYVEALNKSGFDLFQAMARGAIAQINRQSILGIGSKSTARFLNALKVVENNFVRKDIELEDNAFIDYKRNKSAEFAIVNHLEDFDPLSKNFRIEKLEKAKASFEKGFSDEIFRAVENSLNTTSTLAPSLNGSTSSHLCALYAEFLAKSRQGRRLLERCAAEAGSLEQIPMAASGKIPSDYKDQCFYPKYVRLMQSQRLVIRRLQQDRQDPRKGPGLKTRRK
jgi:hypothetical protein